MARRWTSAEEEFYRGELQKLYVEQNKSIFVVGKELGISWKTVYDRMKRLGIPATPERKTHYLGRRIDVAIPRTYSDDLAEFFGIMLGDGHISHFQVMVTLGSKEESYAYYVMGLMGRLFGITPRIAVSRLGYRTVYFGSVDAGAWLISEGLAENKVKSQVDVPQWIRSQSSYAARCIRGFFDTDGSVYRLRYGIQLSFCNHSKPLLKSLQSLCLALGYRVSAISGWNFYITKAADVERFFNEIAPQNAKHQARFEQFFSEHRVLRAGRPVGGGG